jgi:hypothetical protein
MKKCCLSLRAAGVAISSEITSTATPPRNDKLFVSGIITLLMMIFTLPAYADTDFTYNGYVAHQYATFNKNTNSLIPAADTELTKVYLDAKYISDNWTIKLKPEFTYNHLGTYTDITTLSILENYVAYNDDYFGFAAGKKIMGWGQSMLWSPANLIDTRINPTNPLTQQAGASLLQIHAKDKNDLNADIVYKPKLQVTDPAFNYFSNTSVDTLMFRLSTQSGQSDYAISFNYLNPTTVVGLEYAATLDNGLVIYSENSIKSTNQILLRSLNGFRYDITESINLNMEYYYNAEGVLPSQYTQVFLTNSYQFANLSKNYMMTNISYQKIDDKSKYVIMEVNNLDDGSGLMRIGYSYDFSANINGGIDYDVFYGERNSEFGRLPALSAWVFTLKYYL